MCVHACLHVFVYKIGFGILKFCENCVAGKIKSNVEVNLVYKLAEREFLVKPLIS